MSNLFIFIYCCIVFLILFLYIMVWLTSNGFPKWHRSLHLAPCSLFFRPLRRGFGDFCCGAPSSVRWPMMIKNGWRFHGTINSRVMGRSITHIYIYSSWDAFYIHIYSYTSLNIHICIYTYMYTYLYLYSWDTFWESNVAIERYHFIPDIPVNPYQKILLTIH